MGPTILLSIPNTLSTRNLLRTSVFDDLRREAGCIIIVAPFAEEPSFREEFVRENVRAVRMSRYSPGVVERSLVSALYNLYLSGPAPRSLQLFLDRWADNHPSLGAMRLLVTRNVLPRLSGMTPSLEGLFTRHGDTGGYRDLIAHEKPDVAVFSRLFFCDEIPLMRAAVQAGVPTIGAVASWDNLTTKGPLLPRMDQLLVWNDLLKDEAMRYHDYRSENIVVTGAPHHDIAFADRSQFADRATFFARLGLDVTKRLITYAGEDPVIAPGCGLVHRRNCAMGSRRRVLGALPAPGSSASAGRSGSVQRVRQIPGVFFDLPGKPSDTYWMDMGRRDLVHLCETLMHSDVVANVTSTIVVDAAFFDTPSICIGYGYTHPKTHFNSPMRFFEMDHFRYVIDDGATGSSTARMRFGRASIDTFSIRRSIVPVARESRDESRTSMTGAAATGRRRHSQDGTGR